MNNRIRTRMQQARTRQTRINPRLSRRASQRPTAPPSHLCPEHAAEQAAEQASQNPATQKRTPQKPGPKTPNGKQRSRMNAYQHGLTGKLLVVEADQQPFYDTLSRDFHLRYRPADSVERNFLQIIVDTMWRLQSCAALENNLFSGGMIGQAQPTQHDDRVEGAFARVRTWIQHADSFEKLGRYETRLQRNLSRMIQELENAQSKRPASQATEDDAQIPEALTLTGAPVHQEMIPTPPAPESTPHDPPSSQSQPSTTLPHQKHSFREIEKYNRAMAEMDPDFYAHPDDPNSDLPLAYDRLLAQAAEMARDFDSCE